MIFFIFLWHVQSQLIDFLVRIYCYGLFERKGVVRVVSIGLSLFLCLLMGPFSIPCVYFVVPFCKCFYILCLFTYQKKK